jgi:hypothetical protein
MIHQFKFVKVLSLKLCKQWKVLVLKNINIYNPNNYGHKISYQI